MLIHIIDRSDLNRVVCVSPKEKRSYTRLEDLRRNPIMMHRTDVVLGNLTNSGREYTLHVTSTGFTGDMFLLDVLTKEQYEQVMGIAERMRANALEHPEAKRLLADWY